MAFIKIASANQAFSMNHYKRRKALSIHARRHIEGVG